MVVGGTRCGIHAEADQAASDDVADHGGAAGRDEDLPHRHHLSLIARQGERRIELVAPINLNAARRTRSGITFGRGDARAGGRRDERHRFVRPAHDRAAAADGQGGQTRHGEVILHGIFPQAACFRAAVRE